MKIYKEQATFVKKRPLDNRNFLQKMRLEKWGISKTHRNAQKQKAMFKPVINTCWIFPTQLSSDQYSKCNSMMHGWGGPKVTMHVCDIILIRVEYEQYRYTTSYMAAPIAR